MSSELAIKPFEAIPEVVIPEEERKNPVAYLMRAAVEMAPIFRRRTPSRMVSRYGPWQAFLVGPEANRFVMHTHRQSFSHAQGWRAFFGGVWNENLLYLDHAAHAAHRQMMHPAFAPAQMERYIPIMHRLAVAWTHNWGERGIVEIRAELRDLAFAVVVEALLGFPGGEITARLHLLRDTLSRNRNPYGRDAYYRHIATSRAALNAMLRELLASHDPATPDLTGRLQTAHELIDDEYLLGHIQVMLEAGHTTTMDTATWVVGLLATHPEVFQQVRDEVETVLGREGEVTLAALRSLSLVGRVIDEAGRLRTPVDTAPRGALEDVVFANYLIPKGTFVRLHLGACHRLPGIFADPDRFEPGRFAPPREEQKRTPYGLVLFGGGPRVCIGQSFAHAEIRALVAHLALHYDIGPTPDTPANVADTSRYDDSLPRGLPLRFTRRS